MDEATLCDRIALIQSGKILSINTPENIIRNYPDELYEVKSENMYKLLKSLESYDQILNCYAFGEYAHASFKTSSEADAKRYLDERGIQNVVLRKTVPTIEDCFIKFLKN